jgi:hypothetical protein
MTMGFIEWAHYVVKSAEKTHEIKAEMPIDI